MVDGPGMHMSVYSRVGNILSHVKKNSGLSMCSSHTKLPWLIIYCFRVAEGHVLGSYRKTVFYFLGEESTGRHFSLVSK